MLTLTPELLAALASGVVTILGAFFAFSKWVIDKFLKELKPNGGSSVADKVNVNTERLTRVEERVDAIYLILAQKE